MRLTPLTQKALEKAAILHDGQRRKGNKHLPFITHPVTVASIVSQHTDDERVIAAALLHDTVEDTPYTEAELRADFGPEIADIVLGVTAPTKLKGEPYSWPKGTEEYTATLQAASRDSSLVAAADKIHNFRSTLADYTHHPERFSKDFGGTIGERIEGYAAIVEVIKAKIAPSPLFDELEQVWLEYKAFVESIEQ
jgi:guanosine-3',5'-bis(diphosphate) 3'-pyrophosphohydrolase